MATTNATLTLSSSDLTSDTLSLSSTSTLSEAGNNTGLTQTTGLSAEFVTGFIGATEVGRL